MSVESQRYAFRLDHLPAVPAAVRFVSAEPLLGPLPHLNLAGIHWLIAGGESGPGHRTMDEAWVRDLRDQCAAADVAFFFKQWGGRTPKANGRQLDGELHDDMPTKRAGAHATPARTRDPAAAGTRSRTHGVLDAEPILDIPTAVGIVSGRNK